jgi:hypothetical protein
MVDRLVIFVASPTIKLLPQRPYCTFLFLFRPHIPNNQESWQVFPNYENICSFIQNDSYNPKEIVSIEENKIPKGSTPLKNPISTSDVSNNKDIKKRI